MILQHINDTYHKPFPANYTYSIFELRIPYLLSESTLFPESVRVYEKRCGLYFGTIVRFYTRRRFKINDINQTKH